MRDGVEASGFTVFGGSAHALAIADHLRGPGHSSKIGPFAGLVVDDPDAVGPAPGGVRMLSFQQWASDYRYLPCFVAEPRPDRRHAIVARLAEAGGRFVSAFAADHRPYVSIGAGSVVGDHVYIGRLTGIGDHVQISNCISIGHDVNIGDYTTIDASCTVSGHVEIEPGCCLGVGSIIVPGRSDRPLRIGRGAWIAPGSVIIKSVPAGDRMAGNPARSISDAAIDRSVERHLAVAS